MSRCCSADVPVLSIDTVSSLDTMRRVPCSISRQEFAQQFEEARTPVILTGCTEQWKASETWKSLPHLMQQLPETSKWKVTFDPLQEKWEVATWQKIRQQYEAGSFFYIFDQLRDREAREAIVHDFDVPPQFRNADVYQHFDDFPPRYGPRKWFVAGVKDSGTDPHLDPSATDAWNTAVQGYKWWVLFDPSIDLPEVQCDPTCSTSSTVRDWYALVGEHATTVKDSNNSNSTILGFPAEHVQFVLQKPGETLYLPYGYVHAVYNLADCIGYTENYAAGHEDNLLQLWTAVATEGTVDHKRKFFWGHLHTDHRQALYDYYAQHELAHHLGIPSIFIAGLSEVEVMYGQYPTWTIVCLLSLILAVVGMAMKAFASVAQSTEPPKIHRRTVKRTTVRTSKKKD